MAREATAGYKGYGLALVVDMLTAVLAGATSGPSMIGLFSTEAPSDLGQAFWVVDPAVLDGSAGPFEQRLEALCAELVAAPTAPDAPGRVLIPGEPEAAAERLAERRGVVIDGRHHAALRRAWRGGGTAVPGGRARRAEASSPVVRAS